MEVIKVILKQAYQNGVVRQLIHDIDLPRLADEKLSEDFIVLKNLQLEHECVIKLQLKH
jgi:hypothetical protein